MTQDNAMAPDARSYRKQSAWLKRQAAYFRCFSTEAGQIVLADLKNLLPGKVSAKTELETVRNAAVRDVIDYIIQHIEDGKNPEEIPAVVDSRKATVRK